MDCGHLSLKGTKVEQYGIALSIVVVSNQGGPELGDEVALFLVCMVSRDFSPLIT